MFCSDCGHNNPDNHRFCGMCGARLSLTGVSRTPELAAPNGPGPVQAAPLPSETPAMVDTAESAEPAAAHKQAAAVTSEYAPPRGYGFLRPEKTPSDPERKPEREHEAEPATTLSGPSFLGLSGPATTADDGYSYLFEEEQPSRAGRYIGLLLLIVLGVGVYLKWQPLKTWVVNTALSHMQPAADRKAVPTTADSTITTAQATPPAGDATSGTPAIEQSVNPPSNALPQADKEKQKEKEAKSESEPAKTGSAANDEPEKPSAKEAGAARPPVEKAAPAEDKDTAATVEPKKPKESKERVAETRPSAARQAAKPALPQGAELVVAGEKYLYGRGVPRNCGQAVTYFRAAADKRNPRAYSHLGSLYATGQCVPLDRAQAYTFFSRALAEDRSNPYLERNLTMLWRDMSSEERMRATRNRTF